MSKEKVLEGEGGQHSQNALAELSVEERMQILSDTLKKTIPNPTEEEASCACIDKNLSAEELCCFCNNLYPSNDIRRYYFISICIIQNLLKVGDFSAVEKFSKTFLVGNRSALLDMAEQALLSNVERLTMARKKPLYIKDAIAIESFTKISSINSATGEPVRSIPLNKLLTAKACDELAIYFGGAENLESIKLKDLLIYSLAYPQLFPLDKLMLMLSEETKEYLAAQVYDQFGKTIFITPDNLIRIIEFSDASHIPSAEDLCGYFKEEATKIPDINRANPNYDKINFAGSFLDTNFSQESVQQKSFLQKLVSKFKRSSPNELKEQQKILNGYFKKLLDKPKGLSMAEATDFFETLVGQKGFLNNPELIANVSAAFHGRLDESAINQMNQEEIQAIFNSKKKELAFLLQQEDGLNKFISTLLGFGDGCSKNIGNQLNFTIGALTTTPASHVVYTILHEQIIRPILHSDDDVICAQDDPLSHGMVTKNYILPRGFLLAIEQEFYNKNAANPEQARKLNACNFLQNYAFNIADKLKRDGVNLTSAMEEMIQQESEGMIKCFVYELSVDEELFIDDKELGIIEANLAAYYVLTENAKSDRSGFFAQILNHPSLGKFKNREGEMQSFSDRFGGLMQQIIKKVMEKEEEILGKIKAMEAREVERSGAEKKMIAKVDPSEVILEPTAEAQMEQPSANSQPRQQAESLGRPGKGTLGAKSSICSLQ